MTVKWRERERTRQKRCPPLKIPPWYLFSRLPDPIGIVYIRHDINHPRAQ